MFEIMIILKVVISALVVFNVLAEDITSSEHEMDILINLLLNNEINEYTDSVESESKEGLAEPVYSDGAWKCGKCDDIDESNLLYTETYNVEASDDDGFNLQVGLLLQKMSCVTVTSAAGELSSVTRVRGTCEGDGVTLRVVGATQYDVNVYE